MSEKGNKLLSAVVAVWPQKQLETQSSVGWILLE
jgi:hypothetical protein